MKLREAAPGIILPDRAPETVSSVPSEFPSWYPPCRQCVHCEAPPGAALLNDQAFWARALCGKFRDAEGKPVRSIWYERYGTAPSFNDLTQLPEPPVKIGRCGPKAEYFEKRKP